MLWIVVGCTPQGSDRPGDSGVTGGGGVGNDARVVTVAAPVCADAGAREANQLTRVEIGGNWPVSPDHNQASWTLRFGGRGLTVADFDGDGIDDIFAPRDGFKSHMLKGMGDGTFENVSFEWLGEQADVPNYMGSSAADIDGDGDMDVVAYGLLETAALLINDGSASFTSEEHPEWTTGETEYGCGGSASFADYDRDGDLDLFYGRLGGEDHIGDGSLFFCDSHLLRWDGAGYSMQTQAVTDAAQEIRSMVTGWDDFNGDGWLDMYMISDAPPMPNALMLNDQNGGFYPRPEAGLDFVVAGMGLALGDLNGDEYPDLMVPGIREMPTLLSLPEYGNVWAESSSALELYMSAQDDQAVGWGGEICDLDNDGLSDMIQTFGDFPGSDSSRAQPDEIYLNRGGTFERVGAEWGFADPEVNRGFAVADLNDDGWLDIVKRELGGRVFVDLAACGDAAWLEIRLRDVAAHNHHAVGARLRIKAGDQTWTRRIYAGSTSFASSSPPEAHFGLGDLDVIDTLEVEWPDGGMTSYGPIATRQIIEVYRDTP